jgi:hypothetical protein
VLSSLRATLATGDRRIVNQPLPQLLDCKALRAELGISRVAAEAIMRRLPKVHVEDLRKTYVRRDDVRHYLEERPFTNGQIPT